MSSFKLRRPSPAFVLAAIALFVALGGTGYAATRPGGETATATAAKKAAKPLTKAQVQKLIAGYVGAHKAELRGAAGNDGNPGPPGPPGGEGKPGPAGPGAIPVALSITSAQSGPQSVATLGPWTVTLTCSGSATNATVVVHGPGTATSAASTASGGAAGSSYVRPLASIGGGFNSGVNTGAQLSATDFLQSGSTLYELKYQVSASGGEPFEACDIVGDAIPVS